MSAEARRGVRSSPERDRLLRRQGAWIAEGAQLVGDRSEHEVAEELREIADRMELWDVERRRALLLGIWAADRAENEEELVRVSEWLVQLEATAE